MCEGMQTKINAKFQVSPYLVFFLVNAVQVGIGVLTFPAEIVRWAGADAWISILIAGLVVHILIWMMYYILNKEKTDIIAVNQKVLGKWIGNFINIYFLVYFQFMAFVVFRTYLEVIQVWMFPRINLIMISLVSLPLIYYIIEGGFRIVTGICFLGVTLPLYLILTLLFPLEFAHYENLLPIWSHSLQEVSLSAKQMILSYLGFTTLFFYYPFIKEPEKSQKWAHFGVAFTTFIYLSTFIVSMVFYNEEQLKMNIWPTLGLWKIIKMPFVERFEYVGISSWALVILPNTTLTSWVMMRGVKQIFGVKQRKTLIISLLVTLIIVPLVNGHSQIQMLNKWISYAGIATLLGYIPLMFIIYLIYSKVKRKQ